jgi:hypothetical protein
VHKLDGKGVIGFVLLECVFSWQEGSVRWCESGSFNKEGLGCVAEIRVYSLQN